MSDEKKRLNRLTLSQKAADKMTTFIGSWKFIFLLITYIAIWTGLDFLAIIEHWDPYPFIVLNLTLSCFAALQAPIILMSDKRRAEKEELELDYDYAIDRKSEKEIINIQKDIDEIKQLLKKKLK